MTGKRARIRITYRASRQMDVAERWWLRNRDKAPEAFAESVDEAFNHLRDQPGCGEPVPGNRLGARRYFIRRIRYNLYYRLVDDIVVVLGFRHSSRRSLPRL